MTGFLSVLALLTGLAQGPASPIGISQCIRATLPRDAQQQIVNSYARRGLEGIHGVLTQDLLVQLILTCGGPGVADDPQRLERVALSVSGITMRQGAEASLLYRHSISGDALEAAWSGVTPEQRQMLGRLGDTESGPQQEIVAQFIAALRPDLERQKIDEMLQSKTASRDDPLVQLIENAAHYAIGRGVEEAANAQP